MKVQPRKANVQSPKAKKLRSKTKKEPSKAMNVYSMNYGSQFENIKSFFAYLTSVHANQTEDRVRK